MPVISSIVAALSSGFWWTADLAARSTRRAVAAARWLWSRLRRLFDRTGGRHAWVPLVLGIVLVVASYQLYQQVVTPPAPPAVKGAGEVYVDDASIATVVSVTVDPAVQHAPQQWPVALDVAFFAPAAQAPEATAVRWALVLYGDARLVPATLVLPPGTSVTDTVAADPPFAAGDKIPVQVLSGTAYLTFTAGRSGGVRIIGDLPVEVFSQTNIKLALSLPRYGRLQLSPLFDFPNQPGAIDIGIPGTWWRPETFEVDVDAGPNGVDQRIDTASPNVEDPAKLHWQSGESVRALLARTSLPLEARSQVLTFVLGAVVGAGAASILTAVERTILAFRREGDPEPAAPDDPEDPPAPAD